MYLFLCHKSSLVAQNKTDEIFLQKEVYVMSEENKNRNKDKGKQRNAGIKYNTAPKRNDDVEFASESEFLNLNGKRNKRKRK
jgi:hypothetical protein